MLTPQSFSKASALRNKIPSLAPRPIPTVIAVGVASPRAQGQEITKTAIAEVATEPIVVNGIEFTPKMIEDLTKIAEIEASTKKDKKTADSIKSMYKLFIEENEAALRGDWVRVGNLRVRLEVSRTLKIEIVD